MGWIHSDGDYEFGGRTPAEIKREEEERRARERADLRRALERRGIGDIDDRLLDLIESAVRVGRQAPRVRSCQAAGEFLRRLLPERAARADAAALADYVGDRLGVDGPFPEEAEVRYHRALILATWRGSPEPPPPPKRLERGALRVGRFPRR